MKSAPDRGMPYQALKALRTGSLKPAYFTLSFVLMIWYTSCGTMI